jgi:hypothetical protein
MKLSEKTRFELQALHHQAHSPLPFTDWLDENYTAFIKRHPTLLQELRGSLFPLWVRIFVVPVARDADSVVH